MLQQTLMAPTSSILHRTLSISNVINNAPPSSSSHTHTPKHVQQIVAPLNGRRQCLLLLTATTAMKAMELPSKAEGIGFFGLRKKLEKAEEEAEEIVKEGFDTAEKGLEAAEKGVESAEEEIETVLGFGGLAQAGVVAGAELVAVLVATAVVNGILGPEAQKS